MKLKEYIKYTVNANQLRLQPVQKLKDINQSKAPVVVSLTSIPSRLKKVHLTIRSLMHQSMKPEKIVLWLNEELKDHLPRKLVELTGELFEIHFSPLTSSHRKLIHSLELFPDSVIITSDDDGLYHYNWLERLWQEHKLYPDQIITNRCKLITYDKEGNTLPYRQWISRIPAGFSSPTLMPIGCGGVLYPPHSLLPEATNSELFLKLAPKADDLWFKSMSYLNGTICRRASELSDDPIPVSGTRSFTLAKTNVNQDKNREQWNALREYYKFKTPDPDLE